MKSPNMKIGALLRLGFVFQLLFVLVLGLVAYWQTNQIHEQTKSLYDHPLEVRRIVGDLRADILMIHRDMKDLFLSATEAELAGTLHHIGVKDAEAIGHIDQLRGIYLGPSSDLDSIHQAFLLWGSMRAETIRLLREGQRAQAAWRTKASGTAGRQVEHLLNELNQADLFSRGKADALFQASEDHKHSLSQRLIILLGIIVLLTLFIYVTLLKGIRGPLLSLRDAARAIQQGDYAARSAYRSGNEFGELSLTFNSLAEDIQQQIALNAKTSELASLMLSENEARQFFQSTLATLARLTDAKIAAIYLLSDDKRQFDHHVSIGGGEALRASFSAMHHEGEFGQAIASKQVQHHESPPDPSRWAFPTTSNSLLPREIITIPLLNGEEVVAMLSLVSPEPFGEPALKLIHRVHNTLNARILGILSMEKTLVYAHQLAQSNLELEAQRASLSQANTELEIQKSELSQKSAELTEQNTELEMQKKQLDEANRLKTNFLSNMSHELRTPLNSVIALSGVLHRRLQHKIPADEHSYLEVIERNGKNLLALINDILDLSRIESGREEVDITEFSLCDHLREIISMIKPQADARNICLEPPAGDCDTRISSDAHKFRNILQNLIGNAVKFTEKGSVEVRVKKFADHVEIQVADTGIGIAEAHLQHIFDEFRQADSSTSRKFGGTGLGLAIAKKYANMLRGDIKVLSTPARGSVFTLVLPLVYSGENSMPVAGIKGQSGFSQVSSPENGHPRDILLVEDSEAAIIQIRDILEEAGFNLLLAEDGKKAMAILAQRVPDAIILDLMMPGVDGFEVLKHIRSVEKTAHVPVLILTAKHITPGELKFLKGNNIFQLIQKGDVSREELLLTVKAMVTPKPGGTEEDAKPEQRAARERTLVLVVEDNPDNMLAAKALLSGEFDVIEAITGQEGVEQAIKHKPDLILMDIALPQMDGIEAFMLIRKHPLLTKTPVIALTASAMTSDRETILSYGFDAYIPKPIDDKLFFKTIHHLMHA